MNGHLGRRLDAYLDGELANGERRRAEAHLEGCPECRAELERRRALSEILRADTPPKGRKSEQRFVAEVALRLPRKASAGRPMVLKPSVRWLILPVALILGWAFLQAVLLVTSALEWIPGAEETLQEGLNAMIPQLPLPEILRDGVQWLAVPGFGAWDDIALLVAMAAVGLLFTGWFAGWWVGQRASGSHR
ncbi:MAG: anti-sigma factor family protein [Anaerolineales bacterium]